MSYSLGFGSFCAQKHSTQNGIPPEVYRTRRVTRCILHNILGRVCFPFPDTILQFRGILTVFVVLSVAPLPFALEFLCLLQLGLFSRAFVLLASCVLVG